MEDENLMNYSRKKSDGVFSKLFSNTVKSVLLILAAFLLCGGYNRPSAVPEQNLVVSEPDVPVDTADIEAEIGFANPTVGVLTSSFGERNGRMHNGIDIGADANTEIYAAESGVVTFAGTASGYGNYVVISHNNGYETAYAHCNSISVAEGDTVEKGQVIAYVGSTGNSTGPHLHFEVKENGEFSDPLDYVVY